MADQHRRRAAAGGTISSPVPGAERRWRWPGWLVAGPFFGGLVLGLLVPVLFLVDCWVAGALPPGRFDVGVAYMLGYIAVVAAMWGALAGLGAGVVCAVITALVEWCGSPTRRFYTGLAVCVTAPLASLIGALVHRRVVPGFDQVLFPIVPICLSSLVAYWVGALVWSDGRPATDGP